MPTDEASAISGPLAKLGDGVHTVAFAVDDRAKTSEQLSEQGVRVIGGTFVHPGDANGLLVQLSSD